MAYRGRESLVALMDRFGRRSIIGRLFSTYARAYFTLTLAMSRQQELEADDFAVEVAGRDAAAAALAEVSLLAAAWDHYVEEFLDPVHASGKRPSDLFEGFAEILEAPKLQFALASFRSDFEEP